MNKQLILLALGLLLTMPFAFALVQPIAVIPSEPVSVDAVLPAIVTISGINDGDVFSGNPINIAFTISYVPNDGTALADSCSLNLVDLSGQVIEYQSILDSSRMSGLFSIPSIISGEYNINVECYDVDGLSLTSKDFAIGLDYVPTVVPVPTISSSSGGSSSTHTEEEGRGRKVIPTNNLQNLADTSNTATQNIDLSQNEKGAYSRITGAVIGVLGKPGTLGVGIFITLVGIFSLAIYNRERLGIVKN